MEDDAGFIWKILSMCYFLMKVSVFFFLFVALAVSSTCQGQVDDILKLIGVYD